MRQDPYGRSQYGQGGGRRGGGLGNLRWLILLGFLVYGGCYYFSNRDEARKFCRTHDLPQARIAKN